MSKIEGVESVDVSLNEGSAKIRLRPGNSIRLEQFLEIVKNNAFTPKEAKITAVGTPAPVNGRLMFQVAETDEMFRMTFDRAVQDAGGAVRQQIGGTVLMEGVIAVADEGPQTLLVRAVRPFDTGAE